MVRGYHRIHLKILLQNKLSSFLAAGGARTDTYIPGVRCRDLTKVTAVSRDYFVIISEKYCEALWWTIWELLQCCQ